MKNIALLATDSYLYDKYFSELANKLSSKYNVFIYASSYEVLQRYNLNENLIVRYIDENEEFDLLDSVRYSELYPDIDRYISLNYNFKSINLKSNYNIIKSFFLKYLLIDNIKIVIYEPPSNNFSLICSNLCNSYKILYLGLFNSRIEGRTDIIIGNSFNHSDQINSQDSLVRGFNIHLNKDFTGILQKYIDNAGKTYPSYMSKTIWKINSGLKISFDIIYWLLKYPFHLVKNLAIKRPVDFTTINTHTHGFYSYNRKIKALLRKSINSIRYNKIEDLNKHNYFIFPLHYQPEASTSVWGNYWDNQYTIIHRILISLPDDFVLVVKDHPAEFLYYNLDIYKKLLLNPKIIILGSDTNNFELIKNSQGVFTISSTFALEALVMNKKIGVFGNVFYKSFKNCYFLDSISSIIDFIQTPNLTYDFNDLENYIYNSIDYNADFFTEKGITNSSEMVVEFINYLDEEKSLFRN